MALLVRTDSGDPLQLVPAIRAQVAQVDPNKPIFAVASMEQILFNDLSGTDTIAGLLAGIAFVALCLSATGIYGVVSYSVTQRTREIGVRMALGAHPRAVLRMVIGQGAMPVAAGGIVGLLAALALGLRHVNVSWFRGPSDPRSYAGVILSMVLVAFGASYVPARRASHVDPVVALRAE
jgi:putative ABC transport system permease protein